MIPDHKIDLLMQSAEDLRRSGGQHSLAELYSAAYRGLNVDFGPPTTRVGNRKLTVQGCKIFALEIALKFKRERIAEISQSLLESAEADTNVFNILSIDFSRDRVANWSNHQLLPAEITITDELREVDKLLHRRKTQTVHEAAVITTGAQKLHRMRAKIPRDGMRSHRQTDNEIRHYLIGTPSPESALRGLDRVMQLRNRNRAFGEDANAQLEVGGTVAETMSVIWSYIQHVDQPELKARLSESMAAKFREIAVEMPCNTGVSQRIIDIPTAIDWSVTEDISIEDLRRELAEMAAEINENFEKENTEYRQRLFEMTGHEELLQGRNDHANGNEDEIIAQAEVQRINEEISSALKRDLFVQKAEVELVFLRNLNPAIVKDEAERLFDGF